MALNSTEDDPDYQKALEWLVLLSDKEATREDHARFEAWVAADPSHAQAVSRAETFWQRFDIIKPEYERLKTSSGLVARRNILLGAGAILLGGSATYLATRPALYADYTTAIGERKTFVLPDGSSVELGSYSALSVYYSRNVRRIALYRGQGYFKVAPASGRPFVVEAANGSSTALGTVFDVKILDGRVTVSVTEHAVSVEAARQAATVVEAGWQVSYDDKGVEPPVQYDSVAVDAWREDRIVFVDQPLRRVLLELERYRRGRIVLMDRSLGDIPVTAILRTKDTSDALKIIADGLPIRVTEGAGLIAIVMAR